MTHAYAAKRLLEHGPLSFREMQQITGWRRRTVVATLGHLMRSELVTADKVSPRRNVYRLAA